MAVAQMFHTFVHRKLCQVYSLENISCSGHLLTVYGGNTRGISTPTFWTGYHTPTIQDTSEEFAVNCCQQKRSAEIKLH